jgi:hypothetical protein
VKVQYPRPGLEYKQLQGNKGKESIFAWSLNIEKFNGFED